MKKRERVRNPQVLPAGRSEIMKLLKLRHSQADVPHKQDRQLAQRLLKGEDRAIVSFMDIYFPRLYRFALVRLRQDKMAAEDVVQQTLTIASRRIETYRGEASLMAWLAQICRRELVRYQTSTNEREEVISLFDDEPLMSALMETIEADTSSEPMRFAERAELVSLVHYVMDQLPNRYGDILEWKYIEGLSVKEISEKMHLGNEAVQSLVARAKRSFKKAFREIYEIHYGTLA